MTSCLLPKHLFPSKTGCTLKGKNLLSRGANSFLLEYIIFRREKKHYVINKC